MRPTLVGSFWELLGSVPARRNLLLPPVSNVCRKCERRMTKNPASGILLCGPCLAPHRRRR